MNFTRFFFLTALLIAAAARTAGASGFPSPAVSLQGLFLDSDCEAVPELLGDWTGNSDLGGIWTLQQVGERFISCSLLI